ncbi:MAG: zinc ribbon domain-containing protein [Chloroflexi bacterium]|nr:zinc ribbon domain-containing protein [Chloroflexota bacterium]
MDAILEPIGQFWEGFLNNPIVQLASQLIVIYVVLLWLGTAYWAFRDMQARTENPILPYFAAALIIFFTPLLFMFAVVLYLIIRPRETLAEVYERSLAEESLLAEVEKNELCPVCRDRVDADWLVCPNCRTRLHRVCPSCNRLAEPTWPLCAFCGREFERSPRSARIRARTSEPDTDREREEPAAASSTDATAEHGRLRGATPS